MAGGRPTTFTEEMAARICADIASGMSLRSVCAQDGFPDPKVVYSWMAKNETFSQQYARACEDRTTAFAEEILEIADDGSNDWMEAKDRQGEIIGWRENGEALRRSALRVDSRKWLMSKMCPKKFGDKNQTDLNVSGTMTVQVVKFSESDL